MTTSKMTEREILNTIIDGTADPDVLVEYAEKRIEILNKRNASAAKRAAAKRVESDAVTEQIFNLLTDEPQNRDAILAQLDVEGMTPAKVSSRLSKLVREGRAAKEKGKFVDEDGKSHETTLYVVA
jgi:predicted Rossmann fold nucleotide-binding protein DprA/Smf involved in DNA uptake